MIVSMNSITDIRVKAAQSMIQRAGGPTKLAVDLTEYLGEPVKVHRIRAWRYIGVPAHWGVVCEGMLGRDKCRREILNPQLYDIVKAS